MNEITSMKLPNQQYDITLHRISNIEDEISLSTGLAICKDKVTDGDYGASKNILLAQCLWRSVLHTDKKHYTSNSYINDVNSWSRTQHMVSHNSKTILSCIIIYVQ
jgi:hypothetical protein